MKERPNLRYIKNLAGDDVDFIKRLMDVINKELPEERAIYIENYKTKRFQEAAQNVHKLKHKISILGLRKGYDLAESLEKELKNNIPPDNLHKVFLDMLQNMEDFVIDLK